jgi:hypothetical protein
MEMSQLLTDEPVSALTEMVGVIRAERDEKRFADASRNLRDLGIPATRIVQTLPLEYSEITVPMRVDDGAVKSIWSTLRTASSLVLVQDEKLTFARLRAELRESVGPQEQAERALELLRS